MSQPCLDGACAAFQSTLHMTTIVSSFYLFYRLIVATESETVGTVCLIVATEPGTVGTVCLIVAAGSGIVGTACLVVAAGSVTV
eukprot:9034172-Pyramimonas_sp.AAC.1